MGGRLPLRETVLRRLAGDERGAVAIVLALSLTVLVGMVALGMETELWFANMRVLQAAADAAAISAAYEAVAGDAADISAAATVDAGRNGFTVGDNGATIA
ncbi:MAG: hypothetical protein HY985_16295, partial [Magnetospirillum sp.]|nr:hypothetical protein [Magnetospirillum sp.]